MLETSKPRKGTETVSAKHLSAQERLVRNIKAPEGDGNIERESHIKLCELLETSKPRKGTETRGLLLILF